MTGHGSYSASFNNVVRFAAPDKRCKTCRNWTPMFSGVDGDDDWTHLCFLTAEETNSDWHCTAWVKRRGSK